MGGVIVQARNIDSVRIDVLGAGRAKTIPCDLIDGLDHALRHANFRQMDLEIRFVGGSDWVARCDGIEGRGQSPWAAIVELARRV
jgi:hypothetical protein